MKKLIVEITYRDDKKEKFICCDFPYVGSQFITIYLMNFRRKMIVVEGIKEINQYFK